MATVHPGWHSIGALDPTPMPGELELLRYLEARLDDEWQIYFQSPINGYIPDVVVVHPRRGAQIFEVKDWNLEIYTRDPDIDGQHVPEEESKERQNMRGIEQPLWVKTSGGGWEQIRDPLEQVDHYRQVLYYEMIPDLGEAILADNVARRMGRRKNNRYYNVIHRALYFHGATQEQVDALYGDHPPWSTYLSSESLEDDALSRIVPIVKKPDDELWKSQLAPQLMGCLSPSLLREERFKPIPLTRLQREKALPAPGHRRVRGVAGSGKSLIVVNRAARLSQEKRRILIVGFNKTLRHYLRYLGHRTEVPLHAAYVAFDHFHGVCKRIYNDLGLVKPRLEEGSDPTRGVQEYIDEIYPGELLEELVRRKASGRMPRSLLYDAILIDEGQDFLHLWYKLLEQLLTEHNELLLVADPEQNLYRRDFSWTDGSMSDVQFRGRWGKLDTLTSSMRLPDSVIHAANQYATQYLIGFQPLQPSEQPPLIPDREPILRWQNVETDELPEQAIKAALKLREHGAAPGDTAILVKHDRDGVRIVERLEGRRIRTSHIFGSTRRESEDRKRLFNPLSPFPKICTFQSFKGWETPHLVVTIPALKRLSREDHAAIYMAITRTKHDLIVVNAHRELDHVEEFFHT